MRKLLSLGALFLLALIWFSADVPPPRHAFAASGVIIVNTNCGPSPTQTPTTGQQVTYTDQNGNLCINGAGGSFNFIPSGCGTASLANTKTVPFSNAGSASAIKLITGTSLEKVHICAANIGPVAAANNVALIEGTSSSTPCDTSPAGLLGGATAATGKQFAANGGMTYGNGIGIIAQEATSGDDVCLLFSGTAQVDGVFTYAVY